MRPLLTAITLSTALAACAPAPVTKEETAGLDYGPKPTRWQEEIRSYLKLVLTDPKDAIIEFRTEPQQMYQRRVAVRAMHYGWATCVNVNETVTRGAFQGFYPVVFFFRHEKIVQVNGGPGDFGIGAQYARSQCEHLGAPFQG